MLTALDSNVLIDIWNGSERLSNAAGASLRTAQSQGIVLISDVAYAEVCTMFSQQSECDSFLNDLRIRVESLTPATSFLASRYWLSYLRSGGKRIRILPDFLIAAHATNQADALITRDRGFYREHFPRLKVIDPTRP